MNDIHLEPTQFVNVRSGKVTYGVRGHDDEGQFYDNTLDSIPDDDLDFLRMVCDECTDQTLEAMLDFAREHQKGIWIGETYYPYGKIKSILAQQAGGADDEPEDEEEYDDEENEDEDSVE
jgi:hypothetical protein